MFLKWKIHRPDSVIAAVIKLRTTNKAVSAVPYIEHVSLNSSPDLNPSTHPGNLAFTSDLYLEFESPITFFVGENGAGKSTLLEAMAVLSRLPICGGGTNEYGHNHAFAERSILANSIRLAYLRQPRDRYFFRADTAAHFASLLEHRDVDPDFILPGGAKADPFMRYGGESLHQKSHGESFLALMQNRFQNGLFFLDEPESALSPKNQIALMALLNDMVRRGNTQIFIATHSPILLTMPNSEIISFDNSDLKPIALEDTSHFNLTRRILANPEKFWNTLSGHKTQE